MSTTTSGLSLVKFISGEESSPRVLIMASTIKTRVPEICPALIAALTSMGFKVTVAMERANASEVTNEDAV